jgi:hypothetical protein
MARTTPRAPETREPETILASAVRLDAAADSGKAVVSQGGHAWQDRAWHYYDTIGEFRFAANWVGNLLSRAVLYVTKDDGEGPKRVEDPDDPGVQALDELFGSAEGKAQMLNQCGVHYTVAGEARILGYQDGGEQEWAVVSPQEISRRDGNWYWAGEQDPLESASVIRAWRPHPRRRGQADSPARSALPILAEIERSTQHISAQIDSRLAGAGILWIPNQIALATATVKHGETSTPTSTAQAFVDNLMEVMSTALSDRSDPSAMVPIVVTADGDVIDKIAHTKFWSALDEQSLKMRQEALRRFGLSMDMPPEVLSGVGDSNHWAAWSIDESSIKSHSEPLLALLRADLAKGWLRPALQGVPGVKPEDIRKYAIGADTSEMRLRPNRSKEALELYMMGELSAAALLQETGFDKDSAPKDEEFKRWLLRKAASGSTTPEIVVEAMRMLGLDMPRPVIEAPTTEARPDPSLEEHPEVGIPDEVDASTVIAVEQMVFRALERAGNRLRSATGTRPPGVAAPEAYLYAQCDAKMTDFVLEDAWSQVGRFAERLGFNSETLTQSLDSYCRTLISGQKPHDPDLLEKYLRLARGAA